MSKASKPRIVRRPVEETPTDEVWETVDTTEGSSSSDEDETSQDGQEAPESSDSDDDTTEDGNDPENASQDGADGTQDDGSVQEGTGTPDIAGITADASLPKPLGTSDTPAEFSDGTKVINGVVAPRGYIFNGPVVTSPEMFTFHPQSTELLVLKESAYRIARPGGCRTPTFILTAPKGAVFDKHGRSQIGV